MAPEREVVIVGAGPAGMMLAYLLVTNGIRVRVLERHPDFRREFRGEGIQPSVMKALRRLGFLDVLLERGIAVPARSAAIHMDGRPVVTLGGLDEEDQDFGLIVFQEGFLEFLHRLCSAFPHYVLEMGSTVSGVVMDADRVVAVTVERQGEQHEVRGEFFVASSGRNSALRKRVGLQARVLETSFNIYWMKFDPPADADLVPDGFRAYLGGDAIFILYRSYDGRLQVAWGKRWERAALTQNVEMLRTQLLEEIPPPYRTMAEQFGPHTERQMLKVAADHLPRWHVPGLLFLGDAAHTMSPVAGQGINLAIRDAIVASNHIINAARAGRPWDAQLCHAVEKERRPEVERMQTFQVQLGFLMLGAPRWLARLFFRRVLPVLRLLGIRQRLVGWVQGGVTRVEIEHPVTLQDVQRRQAAARERA